MFSVSTCCDCFSVRASCICLCVRASCICLCVRASCICLCVRASCICLCVRASCICLCVRASFICLCVRASCICFSMRASCICLSVRAYGKCLRLGTFCELFWFIAFRAFEMRGCFSGYRGCFKRACPCLSYKPSDSSVPRKPAVCAKLPEPIGPKEGANLLGSDHYRLHWHKSALAAVEQGEKTWRTCAVVFFLSFLYPFPISCSPLFFICLSSLFTSVLVCFLFFSFLPSSAEFSFLRLSFFFLSNFLLWVYFFIPTLFCFLSLFFALLFFFVIFLFFFLFFVSPWCKT